MGKSTFQWPFSITMLNYQRIDAKNDTAERPTECIPSAEVDIKGQKWAMELIYHEEMQCLDSIGCV